MSNSGCNSIAPAQTMFAQTAARARALLTIRAPRCAHRRCNGHESARQAAQRWVHQATMISAHANHRPSTVSHPQRTVQMAREAPCPPTPRVRESCGVSAARSLAPRHLGATPDPGDHVVRAQHPRLCATLVEIGEHPVRIILLFGAGKLWEDLNW